MKLEILEKDCYYHIYNRGINSEAVFINDENKIYFLKLIAKYVVDTISIIAYCLMSNHYHFIMKINSDEKTVTQTLSNLFNAYAKAFNKQNNRTGSLFEKHFKRIKLKDEIYLRDLILYVHLNPKYHLGINFETYRFSSYQAFLSKKETKVAREDVLALFGGIENFIVSHRQKSKLLNKKYTLE